MLGVTESMLSGTELGLVRTTVIVFEVVSTCTLPNESDVGATLIVSFVAARPAPIALKLDTSTTLKRTSFDRVKIRDRFMVARLSHVL